MLNQQIITFMQSLNTVFHRYSVAALPLCGVHFSAPLSSHQFQIWQLVAVQCTVSNYTPSHSYSSLLTKNSWIWLRLQNSEFITIVLDTKT